MDWKKFNILLQKIKYYITLLVKKKEMNVTELKDPQVLPSEDTSVALGIRKNSDGQVQVMVLRCNLDNLTINVLEVVNCSNMLEASNRFKIKAVENNFVV